MSTITIRPKFRKPIELSKEEVIKKISLALEKVDAPIKGTIIDHHVILRIPYEDQHYWSPQLDLEIESDKHGSVIKGLFGPRPSVWFMYIFFYCVLGFVSMMVMIMGFSQLNLGLPYRILWVLPITTALFLVAYSTAKAGQKLGRDEMHLLYNFMTSALTE